jgi:heparan-alpha-glucosaminide N-acetyltransferase
MDAGQRLALSARFLLLFYSDKLLSYNRRVAGKGIRVMEAKQVTPRVMAVDAYRGFVMLLMMAEVLELGRVSNAVPLDPKLPRDPFWAFLAHHQSHALWSGCSLHDLIQPSFTFLVGVALPFSLASRVARGQTNFRLIAHAAWRAFVLIALGIFLRSTGSPQTNFTFEDTLTQIGLGYLPLVLLARAPRWAWWTALVVILVGYWLAFALYPVPGPDFNYLTAGVLPNWSRNFTGFAAHWNKNTNFAWAFDTWFLNLFPSRIPFWFNSGGYSTLSFIPTLGTMILGLIAGDWLKRWGPSWSTVGRLFLVGLVFLGLGWAADATGICPSVKRIWTPSWTLYSGGWCFIVLAGFYAVMDVIGWRAWAFPLRVIGMNSIAAYCIAHWCKGFFYSALKTHIGPKPFLVFGDAYQPLLTGAAVLMCFWLILLWMDWRRIYLRI